jgi:hypothetical protein
MTTCELTSWQCYCALLIVDMSSIWDIKFCLRADFLKAKLPGILAVDHVTQNNYSNSDLLRLMRELYLFLPFKCSGLEKSTSLEKFTYRWSVINPGPFTFQAPSQNCEKRLLPPYCLSVSPTSFNNSAPTGRTVVIFYVWVYFQNFSTKFLRIWK